MSALSYESIKVGAARYSDPTHPSTTPTSEEMAEGALADIPLSSFSPSFSLSVSAFDFPPPAPFSYELKKAVILSCPAR